MYHGEVLGRLSHDPRSFGDGRHPSDVRQGRADTQIPDVLPLIPLRDLILFPNLVVPLFVGRERSISALEQSMRTDHLVALVTQHTAETQDPRPRRSTTSAVL